MKGPEARAIAASVSGVEGWFSFEAAMLFAWFDELQREAAIGGDLFEIGVHRGRSSILMSHLARSGEALGVCDLFGDQGANLSRSGSGDRAIFEENLRRLGSASTPLRVFSKSSLLLTPIEIGDCYRIFHVDGGHNTDEALSDLRLGAACIGPGGILVLDDPFRIEWPGVTEALVRFLDERRDFSAVVVGFNKLVLAGAETAEAYARRLDDRASRNAYRLGYPWHLKQLDFLGRPLRILYVPTRIDLRSLRVRLETVKRTRPWAQNAAFEGMLRVARRILR